MPKRSDRLNSLVKLAQGEENDAAREMGLANEQLNKVQLSLDDLILYQAEYANKFTQSIGKTYTVHELGQYRGFLSQIDSGVKQQHQIIETASLVAEQKRQQWLEKRNRTRALNKAMEKYKEEEQAFELNKEQMLQDEFSARSKNRF